ncbi:vacuolar protein sorting protein 16 [Trypanosoma rangeli]|uniref:Vacuolar protein sorting protein 16 n=1 Tax=Trypanosoma rangeli TaxID=5698 RepID=A0A3R7NCG2_TRYRA|nr:vacuolar protein sorting protein 16 [Trypanosoma rangeli]RNF04308.1 vacuolar protein sorting protein 16 [Trypanosoma rangeli]|eukprot:RNF04308.1 vacuolar protein sorting protein 16 [Trypanosoma rangeli]
MHFELVEVQKRLAAEYGDQRFLQCSVARTLYLCLLHGDEGKAEDLRAKYHVTEKTYTYSKLRALCDAGRWAEAEKLGGVLGGHIASKPSIGYVPFVEQFALHAQVASALRFIQKLDGVATRVTWFMQLQHPRLAIEDAFREKDGKLIQHVLGRTTDSAIQEYGLRCLHELQ